jgi:hypothetical protein
LFSNPWVLFYLLGSLYRPCSTRTIAYPQLAALWWRRRRDINWRRNWDTVAWLSSTLELP